MVIGRGDGVIGGQEGLLSCLRQNGRCPTSFLALSRALSIDYSVVDRGFLSYAQTKHARVILGDPVSSPQSMQNVARAFATRSQTLGVPVAAVAVTEFAAPAFARAGYRGFVCGSEAVVDLATFDLSGPQRRGLRRSIRHATKAGVATQEVPSQSLNMDGWSREFDAITRDWLRTRRTDLLSFIVGEPFMPGWEECRYFIARTASRVEAFVTLYPVYRLSSFYVDIMRRRADSPGGTMDLLLSTVFSKLSREGVRCAYLGMVPGAIGPEVPPQRMTPILRWIFIHLDTLYPMRSEFFYKDKFASRWEPRYAFFYPRMGLRNMTAIAQVLWPNGLAGILRHKLTRGK